jgi:protocatechuate 3,4-dioxygenase beta subunit
VTRTALTDQDGQYNFSGLNPGTYTVTETQPATWASTADTIGTVNGAPRGNNPSPLDDNLGTVALDGGE